MFKTEAERIKCREKYKLSYDSCIFCGDKNTEYKKVQMSYDKHSWEFVCKKCYKNKDSYKYY